LGFIVSHKGITVDPLKVQAILDLPSPRTLKQLQSLQGRSNFLRRFIPDYATTVHGFLRLLRTRVPFVWDEQAEAAFNALKKSLTQAPLISPPDFSQDFILYISASEYAVSGVLVQEDASRQEHVIYYVSQTLSGPPLRYPHEERLALAVVFSVQKL
jgi:hypothetical protein